MSGPGEIFREQTGDVAGDFPLYVPHVEGHIRRQYHFLANADEPGIFPEVDMYINGAESVKDVQQVERLRENLTRSSVVIVEGIPGEESKKSRLLHQGIADGTLSPTDTVVEQIVRSSYKLNADAKMVQLGALYRASEQGDGLRVVHADILPRSIELVKPNVILPGLVNREHRDQVSESLFVAAKKVASLQSSTFAGWQRRELAQSLELATQMMAERRTESSSDGYPRPARVLLIARMEFARLRRAADFARTVFYNVDPLTEHPPVNERHPFGTLNAAPPIHRAYFQYGQGQPINSNLFFEHALWQRNWDHLRIERPDSSTAELTAMAMKAVPPQGFRQLEAIDKAWSKMQ